MPDERLGVLRQAKTLFPRLRPEAAVALEGYRQVLKAVHPLKPRHAQELPLDIKDLSLALTAERGPGPAPNYLAHPASLSAYLHYFLPWNLYRLSRLFGGLDFNLPDGASVLDIGAGPLTLAQALWMAKPELRARKLRFVCLDQTASVLRVGRELFEALVVGTAGAEGCNWTIELLHGPLHKAPMEPFTAVCALNSINELGKGRGEEGHQALDRLAEFLASRMAPGSRALLVEPGTRQGGKLLARLRGILMEEGGLQTLGPCTHQESCPMLEPKWRSWCHFVFSTEDAPGWLAKLSKDADLEKDRVSLSYLDMAAGIREFSVKEARIVSSRFKLDQNQACYACAAGGLHLLALKRFLPGIVPGAWAEIDWPVRGGKDFKTGAWLTPLSDREEAEAPVVPATEIHPAPVRKSKHPAWAKLPSQRPRKAAAAGGEGDSGDKRPDGQKSDAGRKPAAKRERPSRPGRSDNRGRGDGQDRPVGSGRGDNRERGEDRERPAGPGRSDNRAGGDTRKRGEDSGRAKDNRGGEGREGAAGGRRGEGAQRDGNRERDQSNRRGEGRNRPAGSRQEDNRESGPSGRGGQGGRPSSSGNRDSEGRRDSGGKPGSGRPRDAGRERDADSGRGQGGTRGAEDGLGRDDSRREGGGQGRDDSRRDGGGQGRGDSRREGGGQGSGRGGSGGARGSGAPSGGRAPGGKPSPQGKRGSSGKPGTGKPGAGGKPGRSSGKPGGGKPGGGQAPSKRSGR